MAAPASDSSPPSIKDTMSKDSTPTGTVFDLTAAPGTLGLIVQKVPDGVKIKDITPSCTLKDRVVVGDIVVAINGRDITSTDDLMFQQDKERKIQIRRMAPASVSPADKKAKLTEAVALLLTEQENDNAKDLSALREDHVNLSADVRASLVNIGSKLDIANSKLLQLSGSHRATKERLLDLELTSGSLVKDVNASTGLLNSEVTARMDKVSSEQKRLSDAMGAVSVDHLKNKNDISELKATLDSLQGGTHAIKENVAATTKMQTEVTKHEVAIAALKSKTDEVLPSHKAKIGAVESSIVNLQEDIRVLIDARTLIASHKTAIDELKLKTEKNESKLSLVDSKVVSLQKNVSSQHVDFTKMLSNQSTATQTAVANVSSLKGAYEGILSELGTVKGSIQHIYQTDSKNDDRVAQLEKEVKRLNERNASLDKSNHGLLQRLVRLEGQLASLSAPRAEVSIKDEDTDEEEPSGVEADPAPKNRAPKRKIPNECLGPVCASSRRRSKKMG